MAAPAEIDLVAKWNGSEYQLKLAPTSTVLDVKKALEAKTEVQAKRQKLVGLSAGGKMPTDETTLQEVTLKKPPHRFMMVGTVDRNLLLERHQIVDIPELIDDIDFDIKSDSDLKHLEETKQKLRERLEAVQVQFINPPRPGKKLLVLDLDYTLLDFKSTAERIEDLKRPYTDWFLEHLYPEYDLVVWSQTSWRWLEAKLTEMGLLQSEKFKFTFVLDRTAMFKITSKLQDGTERAHEVKPLEFIWTKFPLLYNAQNTVHVDDLGRNFALNPKNGLKISAFRNAAAMRSDKELLYIAQYLALIAKRQDWTSLDHNKWREFLRDNGGASIV
mmetsp:Transcript_15014/g.35411  ORF Transcript_15014/g.35411 Transcript_15014/m.35411 type:complete len:330 (-) Transcript_15014:119-1108(-)|eukprot:CAMPEP_0114565020 /NCGR_PEP_ID=MMETSP0114-20121206/14065_1 /TAXON_ID=31324 /ORGANISM="Goniomonas sp, Strain m" /LENGTH=329 /DNA_ID=CAMNT_0001751195 /DNA_START=16 /DNA_END=1005 /DNA_ORIENTATION=-